MLDKVLIANRGEIACRIIATCRRLGVASVAVYADADAGARHVRLADEAIHIGPSSAAESYLSVDAIIAAARQSDAGAIHPGYGFLSENADFAHAVAAAGLVFIGPLPATIARMGSKSAAKTLMEAAGVPVVPGYHGDDQADAALRQAAEQIGFPLLVKASAGGGGKGMRIVHAPDGLDDALAAARREARSAFGDDRLLLEKFLLGPRHIEFQIFGDHHGNVVHLFERECSIQRRYQKVVEESPSPFVDRALREEMAAAAVAAARAVDYRNAGTVEFIVDEQRRFYFLEMNTRLQVEHPVTECTTGLDLVEWQLRVAAGEPLPLRQDAIASDGHAIEVRLYAEDPDRDFLPATGTIERFAHPANQDGVRLDNGYEDGDTVSIHYDPMIAKLVCYGEDRSAARARLRQALAHTEVFGPATNLALLRRIVADAAFAAGDADTGYLDASLERLGAEPRPDELVYAAAAVAVMQAREQRSAAARSPWDIADGWQANGRSRNRLVLCARGQAPLQVDVAGTGGRYRLRYADAEHHVRARPAGADRLSLETQHHSAAFAVLRHDRRLLIAAGDQASVIELADPYPAGDGITDDAAHPGSPMPGRIVAIRVAAGDTVAEGQPLVVLEGMKMEFTVRARTAGTVETVLYGEGDLVDAEVPLVDIAPAGAPPE